MGYNCDCTRPVSRWSWLTNNGYWNKLQQGWRPILYQHISYWARTARLMVRLYKQCLKDSRATAIVKMRVEWALEGNTNPMTIISLSRKWDLFSTHGKVRPGNAYPVAVINLLAARERRPEPTQVVQPLELLSSDGTTSSSVSNLSLQPERRENCKWAIPMACP